jgi:hypothetical protein
MLAQGGRTCWNALERGWDVTARLPLGLDTHRRMRDGRTAKGDAGGAALGKLLGGYKAMTFDDILDQAIALLKRQGRVSYGAIKRRFDLDDV